MLLASQDVLHGWLWRVPFLASALLIVVALWIRFRIKESPSFTKLQTEHHVDEKPLRNLFRNSRRNLLIGFCLRLAENGGSSIYQTLSISYVVTVALAGVKSPGPIGPLALVGAALVSAVVVLVAGLLSDRFGRVPVYRAFAIFQLVMAVPTWWVMSTGSIPATVAVISLSLGVGAWGMFGVSGAFLPELFGANTAGVDRDSGVLPQVRAAGA
jgi:MHS family metabolite:H+ symporter-like MFS transporter